MKYDVLEKTEDLIINNVGEKILYNTDKTEALNEFVKKKGGKYKNITYPNCSSFLNTNQASVKIGENFIGYLNCNGNNVQYNQLLVGLYSMVFSGGSKGKGHSPGFTVNEDNFFEACYLFTSRKLIVSGWLNQKDEYLVPNMNHEEFEQYKFDSLVYSLFGHSSNQSSLRQVEYKGQMWDIKNEFFWMSKDRMKELADENGYDNLYNDARTSADRHVYKLLFGEERIYDKLSDDAKAVLDKATELVERSMELRQVMANDDNHLDSWDSGYAQLKLVWKEYFQEEFQEFRQLYKNLEDRMRPLVYELGFLMK